MVNSGKKRTSKHARSAKENIPFNRKRANIRIRPKKQYLSNVNELGCGLLSDSDSSEGEKSEITPCVPCDVNDAILLQAPRVLQTSQRENIQSVTQTIVRPSKHNVNLQSRTGYPEIPHNDTDYFSLLSDEIILHVFYWLPKFTLAKCARVCRRWNCVVGDRSLWKRIDLANRRVSTSCLGLLLHRGVQVLRLTKAEIIEDGFDGYWKGDLSGFESLQYLDLSLSSASTQMMEHLFSSCPNLRKLSMELCSISDSVAKWLGHLSELQVLNLSMCDGLSTCGLANILAGCRKLTSLNLAWTGLRQESVACLCQYPPPSLRKLNLSGCRENITDQEVRDLALNCPGLLELDLSDSTVITSDALDSIICSLSNIQSLALSRCYRLSCSSIRELSTHPSLSKLEVFGMFRDGTMEQLKQEMEDIELNRFPFSSIARPTTGIRMTSLWGLRVRENAV
ncbi:S-phase kinase-associated protein 2-like [Crassostrea virginica]